MDMMSVTMLDPRLSKLSHLNANEIGRVKAALISAATGSAAGAGIKTVLRNYLPLQLASPIPTPKKLNPHAQHHVWKEFK